MTTESILHPRILEFLSPALPLPEAYQRKAFRLPPEWQIGIALMLNLLSLAVPIMMLQVYDRIIPHQAYGTLTLLVIGVLIALVLDAVLRMTRAHLTGWTAASNEHAAAAAAMERLASADLTAFEASIAGTHLQNFAALSRLREFYSGQSLSALVDLPFAALFLLLIAYLGGWLVLVPLSLLAFFYLFSQHAGNWLKSALEARSTADDCKASYVIAVLSGIHTVKAMGMEASLMRRFESRTRGITESSYRVALASGVAGTLSAAFSQLSLILTASAGSLLVLHGDLSVGGLSACTLLAGRALQPVQRVLGTWLRLQDFAVARRQAETLLALPVQSRTQEPLPEPQGHLLLKDVSFGYGENLLLQHIALDIAPGEAVAITGDKGSGKSTLLQLMAGLLAPTEGVVRLDGFNPAQHGLSALHAHIGYLPQAGVIFKGSILDNITGFMNDEASVESAKEAAAELGLDAVVDTLPKGYATLLDGGPADPVPPGVRQRIALARVLRHKPKLLLFDDADRALDKEGYNRLFKLMGRLKGHTSLVIVSHDRNLMSFADHFYRLDNGSLTAIATGDAQMLSLLAQKTREIKP